MAHLLNIDLYLNKKHEEQVLYDKEIFASYNNYRFVCLF